MKEYKTTHRLYSAWNYQREIDDLNAQSEKGWQLVKGGSFSSRFKFDDSIVYRYQLDYQPDLKDRPRYVESFREFGWEYINSTFNGWHYFRKPYDPALPEEEYEIFSDRSSLQEMNNRWAKLGIFVLVFASIFTALQLVHMVLRPSLPTLAILLEYIAILAVFIRGVSIMRNPDKNKSRRGDNWLMPVFLLFIITCAVGYGVLAANRPNMNCDMTAEYMDAIPAQLEEAVLWNTAEVKYPDLYHIDAEIKADAPVTVSVVNAAGETVYTVTGDDISEEDVRLLLSRGEYRIYLSDFAGGEMKLHFEID